MPYKWPLVSFRSEWLSLSTPFQTNADPEPSLGAPDHAAVNTKKTPQNPRMPYKPYKWRAANAYGRSMGHAICCIRNNQLVSAATTCGKSA